MFLLKLKFGVVNKYFSQRITRDTVLLLSGTRHTAILEVSRPLFFKSSMFSKLNPLKTKRICFIYGLSAYRAVNTLHFGYKNQSLNVL
jgi:hypothetical protein